MSLFHYQSVLENEPALAPTRNFFQDFGNTTHTHGIGNFSCVLLKIGKNA
jgi:hypothetical protein